MKVPVLAYMAIILAVELFGLNPTNKARSYTARGLGALFRRAGADCDCGGLEE